jgi:hypothetical protein
MRRNSQGQNSSGSQKSAASHGAVSKVGLDFSGRFYFLGSIREAASSAETGRRQELKPSGKKIGGKKMILPNIFDQHFFAILNSSEACSANDNPSRMPVPWNTPNSGDACAISSAFS